MAGTQGWTQETWDKLRKSGKATGGRAAGSYTVKSCGKAHPGCIICAPDKVWKHSSESYRLTGQQAAKRGTFAGSNNPRWKGGKARLTIGWKAARIAVWQRDKLCRACGLVPYPNRRLDVHHIVPRRSGGTNCQENLVGLHHGCHMKVEAGKMNIDQYLGVV